MRPQRELISSKYIPVRKNNNQFRNNYTDGKYGFYENTIY